jgi:regulator of RNase E activity RraA
VVFIIAIKPKTSTDYLPVTQISEYNIEHCIYGKRVTVSFSPDQTIVKHACVISFCEPANTIYVICDKLGRYT